MAKILLFLLVLVAVFMLGRDMVMNRLNLILSDYLVRNIPFVFFLVVVSVETVLLHSGITLQRLSAHLLMLDGLMILMPSSYERTYPALLFPSVLILCYLAFILTAHLASSTHAADAIPALAVPIVLTAFYCLRLKGRFSQEYSFFAGCSYVIMVLSTVEALVIGLWTEADYLSAVSSILLIALYTHAYLWRSRGCRPPSTIIRKPVLETDGEGCLSAVPVLLELKDEQYRMEVLFSRVEKYMKEKEPYLDEHLTLAEMASALYTNKASLSKAINSVSGRNYCQYVNKYRVDYAVSLMMKDKRLKVIEIAMMSGFHSLASFNMAFRLFRGDTPSEYMRTIHLTDRL